MERLILHPWPSPPPLPSRAQAEKWPCSLPSSAPSWFPLEKRSRVECLAAISQPFHPSLLTPITARHLPYHTTFMLLPASIILFSSADMGHSPAQTYQFTVLMVSIFISFSIFEMFWYQFGYSSVCILENYIVGKCLPQICSMFRYQFRNLSSTEFL